VSAVKEQVNALIDAHCQTHAEYRHERYRVTMAELSGQPHPETVVYVEESLSKVYGLLFEANERLAAVAAVVERINNGKQGGTAG
jgi:hypothetical protein